MNTLTQAQRSAMLDAAIEAADKAHYRGTVLARPLSGMALVRELDAVDETRSAAYTAAYAAYDALSAQVSA